MHNSPLVFSQLQIYKGIDSMLIKTCHILLISFASIVTSTVYADVCPPTYQNKFFRAARLIPGESVQCLYQNYSSNQEISYNLSGDFIPEESSTSWRVTTYDTKFDHFYCVENSNKNCVFFKAVVQSCPSSNEGYKFDVAYISPGKFYMCQYHKVPGDIGRLVNVQGNFIPGKQPHNWNTTMNYGEINDFTCLGKDSNPCGVFKKA